MSSALRRGSRSRTSDSRPRCAPNSRRCGDRACASSSAATPSAGGSRRDLHDGAQQRLLALVVRSAARAGRAESDGDDALATTLAAASDEAQAALEELRELAHGIYPAVLAEAGLATALATLADEAPLPVELGDVRPERSRRPVEAAPTSTVAEAIDDAAGRGATCVTRRRRRPT